MTVGKLSPEAKAYAERIMAPLVGNTGLNQTERARRLSKSVDRAAGEGNRSAGELLEAFTLNGAAAFLKRFEKAERGTVLVARTGAVLSMPTRFGVPRRDATGIRQKGFQAPLWWELSWDQFEELIASLDRQSARLGYEAEAFRDVLRLRDQYPMSNGPGEACQLAGIDPSSFELAS